MTTCREMDQGRGGSGQRSEVRFRNANLKRLLTFVLAVEVISVATSWNAPAAEKTASFEGTVSASFTRGGTDTKKFLFTRKGNQLRIEDADKSKPEPINIVDLDAKKLTIIFPHNSTFVHVDLIPPLRDRAQPGAPNLPPGFPTPPNIPAAPIGARPGPAIPPPPGIPSPPPLPAMPPMPNNRAPAGALNMPMPPSPGFGAPGMPPMPAMPGAFVVSELKKTDKTRTIHGMECTLYTLRDRGQNFEIWATNDSVLFPFRLLQRDYMSRHFGPQMLEEQWVELLQKKSLFPLEATLTMEPNGQERLSFKVDKIEKKRIDDAAAFSPPKDFYEIQAPQF